jgi:mannan endo-1,4-beta-mannosidase
MNHPRRKFLGAVGTVGVASIAGCAALTNTTGQAHTLTGQYDVTEVVRRDGTKLVREESEDRFQYSGMMAQLTHTQPSRNKDWINQAIKLASEYNIGAYRVWGFPAPSDDVPAPHQAPGEFDDEWIDLFDYAVAKAKENGVRLVVPLLQGVYNRTDRPDRYKQPPSPVAYGTWSESATYQGEYTQPFIEDETANDYFKEYIEYVLTHENQYTGVEYRNEPTILCWECANELEYKNPDREGASLDFWYKDIAGYIKSLGASQLVGTGMHGSMGEIYESWTDRCAYIQDHQVAEIDVCTFHDYPVYWGSEDGVVQIRSPELAKKYAGHKMRVANEVVEKPVYCGEYGALYMPDAKAAEISRIESEVAASDIENEGFPPYKEQKEAYDGVLTTRREEIGYEADLSLRNEYFREMSVVADEYDQDGMHFWRLAREAGSTGPEERMSSDPLIVYPEDTDTLDTVAEYHDTVLAGE